MQTPHPLDRVQMNAFDRERAKAHMRRAEYIVELVAHGVSTVRSVIALVVTRFSAMDVERRQPTKLPAA
jgi:hypothetical protein